MNQHITQLYCISYSSIAKAFWWFSITQLWRDLCEITIKHVFIQKFHISFIWFLVTKCFISMHNINQYVKLMFPTLIMLGVRPHAAFLGLRANETSSTISWATRIYWPKYMIVYKWNIFYYFMSNPIGIPIYDNVLLKHPQNLSTYCSNRRKLVLLKLPENSPPSLFRPPSYNLPEQWNDYYQFVELVAYASAIRPS